MKDHLTGGRSRGVLMKVALRVLRRGSWKRDVWKENLTGNEGRVSEKVRLKEGRLRGVKSRGLQRGENFLDKLHQNHS